MVTGLGSLWMRVETKMSNTETEIVSKIDKMNDDIVEVRKNSQSTKETVIGLQIKATNNENRLKTMDSKVDKIQYKLIPQSRPTTRHIDSDAPMNVAH